MGAGFLVDFRFLLVDAIILLLMPLLSLLIRFDGAIPPEWLSGAYILLPVYMVTGLLVFTLFGLYRRIWRYARVRDMNAIIWAVTVACAATYLIAFFARIPMPNSVYIISWMLTVAGVGVSRLVFKVNLGSSTDIPDDLKQVLIVGAGAAGSMLMREIEQNEAATMQLVGFVDDAPAKVGKTLAGVPILGTTKDIATITRRQHVDEIIIAMPSVDGTVIRRIADGCRRTGCDVQIMPELYETVGRATSVGVRDLRHIRIEDLLRREPIHLDFDKITSYIAGKTVLITGAGGSIGSELARQISRVGARTIILLGRGENSIYQIHQELKVKYPDQDYRTVIANITDRTRMQEVFDKFRPQVIFHAAAHKHVPLMEIQPAEAVHNNVFGTKNVAELADAHHAEIFVMISTDKAVNPTSVMGATKRACELLLQEIGSHSQTKFVTTRFGNVLGSRGSVVPLFEKQIAAGGPVTVTHPEMTRFFMTIPEAVQLVLQAGSQAEGGEVFLFDMGEPVKIKDMACDLIRLHGLEPGKDIPIVYTGLRPGEKLYEELLTKKEGTTSTKHKKIFRAQIHPLDSTDLAQSIDTLRHTRDTKTILETLRHMIPTYQSKQLEQLEGGEKAKNKI